MGEAILYAWTNKARHEIKTRFTMHSRRNLLLNIKTKIKKRKRDKKEKKSETGNN